jgi:hypothetical protein
LVYEDDIIFGCTNESSVQWFSNSMQREFEMSMIGELSYFLVLQVKQKFNRNFYISRKIFERDVEEILDGGFLSC